MPENWLRSPQPPRRLRLSRHQRPNPNQNALKNRDMSKGACDRRAEIKKRLYFPYKPPPYHPPVVRPPDIDKILPATAHIAERPFCFITATAQHFSLTKHLKKLDNISIEKGRRETFPR